MLSSFALAGLVFVFVTRARNAMAVPAPRLSWLASGVGSFALFARGYVVPLPILDGFVGGTNLINLIQNTCSTIAFWLVMQAVVTRDKRSPHGLRWWPLMVLVASFSVPFFFIDRGVTSRNFIVEELDQVAMWLYASIYMAGVAGMCIRLAVGVRGRPGKAYRLIVLGSGMVAIGSIIEVIFLTLGCFSLGTPELLQLTSGLFDPFFYGGVVLIAIGIATFAAARRAHERKVRRQLIELEQLATERGLVLPRGSEDIARVSSYSAVERLYELVIVLHDDERAGSLPFNEEQQRQLTAADETIATRLVEVSDLKNVALRDIPSQ